MSGCFVDCSEAPASGEEVDLRLDLLGERPLIVSAEVVYSIPFMGFGVRFVRLSAEARNALAQGIAALPY